MPLTHILVALIDTVLALGVMNTLMSEEDVIFTRVDLWRDGIFPLCPDRPHPDLIVAEVGMQLPGVDCLAQFSNCFPQADILAINSSENWVKFLDHQEALIREPTDLVSIIHNIRSRKEDIQRQA